ncbi:pseudouridine synthase [Pseudomonas sp. BN414]|uniref:pseudouridine synthase n=1 Tax=Pseudomonas sp. BN414 TaxID=2567888 RepID=UPI0024547B85|nr:pseudouridine synthase [Pseudomonas sp. BN414]MDH4566236.1 pseudouridine synthase [Pseudomonas sp. BN414]
MSHNPSIRPSVLHLPQGDWSTVLDCLCERFPAIAREIWVERMESGKVTDGDGNRLTPAHPYQVALRVHYYREVKDEKAIPFEEAVLHVDAHLVVADKPHFLPVMPAGEYVEETLQARLTRRLGNPHLVPLHRIDRHTAGLVLFSANPASRNFYHALFRDREIHKRYEAIAPALPGLEFPLLRETRLGKGEPFFRMQEMEGEPNTRTRLDVLEKNGDLWRYDLSPITGKQHQLRVHLAALGAPICNDGFYPELTDKGGADDYQRPLKLLARSLVFDDPISGESRYFESRLRLDW